MSVRPQETIGSWEAGSKLSLSRLYVGYKSWLAVGDANLGVFKQRESDFRKTNSSTRLAPFSRINPESQ